MFYIKASGSITFLRCYQTKHSVLKMTASALCGYKTQQSQCLCRNAVAEPKFSLFLNVYIALQREDAQ